ncbi:MAG: N-6 DNA methylase [Roseiarcus sp.]|jgi:type I restriction enzyme M protein
MARPAPSGIAAFNSAIWSVCDVLRRSKCAGAMQYVPELTWILFLRFLDDKEQASQEEAEAVGAAFVPSLKSPYRWRDWAAPGGAKRKQLEAGALGALFGFVNGELIPHLKSLAHNPNASARQKIIGEALSGVEKTRIDTEKNLLDVLDRVDALNLHAAVGTHMFPLSQVYEGLLLKMGDKGNDGGQFFTPREIIRVIVRAIDPQPGQTIYDPCCGTGGFLAEAFKHVTAHFKADATVEEVEALGTRTLFGREKEDLVYPLALANLMLHGVDRPHIWHGNTLTGGATYDGLWRDVPTQFDIVLTNPPFGGKEGKEAQSAFAYKTRATQILFLQHVIDHLKKGGRCGMVVDEGVLFRNEGAYVQTKRKLLDSCDLWAILSLPAGAFINAGAGVKTDLLFFTKGTRTESVWYYDLADVKVGKKSPLTLDRFEQFFELLPARGESERSWTVTRAAIEAKNYDLKAVNPNRKFEIDSRSPAEILTARA